MCIRDSYSSTKAALEMYVEALRLEGRRHGITATIIEPGDLSTGFTGSRVIAEPTDSPYYDECQRRLRGRVVRLERQTQPSSNRANKDVYKRQVRTRS